MFISGGENIHPEAIEAFLNEVAGVELAVVVDVPHPEFGARPVAFVSGSASPAALTEAVRKRLPGFHVPDAIYPLPDSFASGVKPARSALRKLARSLKT
jgi:O-succinylbenzoic acid--CoA ligase